ncbi:unnamed protein product [Sphagnum balticum]
MSVDCEKNGEILVVTINRVERKNAVDGHTAASLAKAFIDFHNDETLKVAVLTGGGGTFCAGADLKSFAQGEGNRVGAEGIAPMGPSRLRLSKPVIAAVEGFAVAGGLELALWCDLRVAANDSTFGVFCRRFGVPLVDLGTIRLPRLIGHSRAMDLILTGRPVKAQEAFDIGLVNRLAEPGKALADAIAIAKEIAVFPQICMRNDRLSALEQWDLSEEEAIQNELRYGFGTLRSGESKSGAEAFSQGKGRHGTFT